MRRLRPVVLFFWLGLLLGTGVPALAKERWSKVESPYFTLYAECGVSDAKEWAACFEQFRRYVTDVIRIPPTQLQPLTMVVFKDRAEIMRFLPQKNGKAPTDMASMTMTLPTGTVILTSLNWDDDTTRQSFYQAGTYWLLSGFKYGGPDWFRAGLAGTFKTFTVLNDEVRIGMALDQDVIFLRENHLMSLPELFRTNMNQLDFRASTRTDLFYAQSWLLVHYLIYSRETRKGATRSPQLGDFLEALQYGVPVESAFQQVFGTDYEGMNRRLEAYLLEGRYAIFTGKFDRAGVSAGLKATGEIPAGPELARGYACLAGNLRDEARAHFLTARAVPGAELPASEVLGDMAQFDNNPAEAGIYYGRAQELGSRNFHAAFFFGEEVMRGQMQHTAELPRFEARQARKAANQFEQAINRYPDYVPSFERLALLMPSLEVFSEADRQFLELGRGVAPGNDLIEAGLGVWELKNGRKEQGQQRLRGLLAEGRPTTGWARLIAQDLADAQSAGQDMAIARRLMDEGKTDEAGELVEKLLQTAHTQEQRAALVALRSQIGQLDLVMQAEQLAGSKEWDAAQAIAQSVIDGHPSDALRQRAEAVLARVPVRK